MPKVELKLRARVIEENGIKPLKYAKKEKFIK